MLTRELHGAAEHLERLRTRWRRTDGMLATIYRGSSCIDATPLVADLGDTAPFLAALGFPSEAIELAHAACRHLSRGLFRRGDRVYLFDNHDLLLGLLELYEQTGEGWLIERSRHALEAVRRECEVSGRLVDWADPQRRSVRASPYNAGYIEVAVDLYRATQEPTYLQWAKHWAHRVVQARSFQRHGLWSRFDTPRFPLLGAVLGRISRRGPWRMFKDNTNCVWALLALFLHDEDTVVKGAIDRFIGQVARLFGHHGHIPEFAGDSTFNLSANIFVADLLADLAHFRRLPTALELACDIVEAIERKRWKNGLLPSGGSQPGDHLDLMIDFGVALCKLDVLAGGRRYHELAEEGWRAAWKSHQTEEGLVLSVDAHDRIVDDRIIVKYQFLATKALLVGERSNIYDDAKLWRLLRDR